MRRLPLSIKVLIYLVATLAAACTSADQIAFHKEFTLPASQAVPLPDGYWASLDNFFPVAGLVVARLDEAGTPVYATEYHLSGGVRAYFTHLTKTNRGGFAATGTVVFVSGKKTERMIAKSDAMGKLKWLYAIPGAPFDTLDWVEETSEGGYIAAGNVLPSIDSSYQGWAIKFDQSGNVAWSRAFEDVRLSCVQVVPDGSYFLSGSIGSGALLIKLSSTGRVIWHRTYLPTTSSGFYITSLDVAPSGGVILAGSSSGSAILIRVGSKGGVLWTRSFDSPSYDLVLSSVVLTKAGEIVAAGSSNYPRPGDGRGLLLKTDSLGKIIWARKSIVAFSSLYETLDHGFSMIGMNGSADDLIKTNSSGLIPDCSTLQLLPIHASVLEIRSPKEPLRVKSFPVQLLPVAFSAESISITSQQSCR